MWNDYIPYFKNTESNELNWAYCLHNIYSDEDVPSDIVKIKIFTDIGYEFVHNINSLSPRNNHILTCTELDKFTGFKDKTKSTATIQFESRSSSIGGSFFVYDPESGLIGTDHITGG